MKWADTTAWAASQDRVIAGESPVILYPFEGLYMAQKAACPTNLTVRQDALLGRLKEAEKGFKRLVLSGRWTEGPSYLEYTSGATGKAGILGDEIDLIWREYSRFQDPTGGLPFPETHEGLKAPYPAPKEDVTEAPGLYCRRWFDSEGNVTRYFLLFLDPKPGNPKNLHVWPSFGHYVLWENGEWIKPPHYYTGWPQREPTLKEEWKYLNAPRGPWNEPVWRFKQSALKIEKSLNQITLKFGGRLWGLLGWKKTVKFTFSDDGVR